MAEENGWDEYKRLVIYRLGEIERRISRLEGRMARRAGFWGAVSGAVPALGALLYSLLTGKSL